MIRGLQRTAAVLYVSIVCATAYFNKPYSLFTAHPVLMSLLVFFVSETLLAFSPVRLVKRSLAAGKLPRTAMVNVHRLIAFLALNCAIGGAVCIYLVKDMLNKPHFATKHGWYGFLVLVWLLGQFTFGALAHNFKLSRQLLRMHGMSGFVLMVCVNYVAYIQTSRDNGWLDLSARNLPFGFHFAPWHVIAQGLLAAITVSALGTFKSNAKGRA
ncbi:hypothetical protein BC831DRAFT_469720 [Entophlyctis helioformis]|nr:hypothetical protein BC831DRAFT_469720 [Entophlyctis helioformis]